MAVNFNLLAREGPTNLYEGFERGQQAAAQNALAQQKMAQERELGALRRAELVGNIRAQEEKRAQDTRVLRANQFKDQLLRAPTAEAMREIIRQQHADPILGPTRKQFGSLEQDLAEVPDDPAGLEEYRRREAMGISEWIKSTYKTQQDRAAMGLPPLPTFGVRGAAAPAAAPEPVGELVAEPIAPPTGTMREIAPGGTVGAEAPLTRGAQANVLAPTPPAPPPAANVLTMSPEEQRARAMLLSDNPGIREAGKIELARLTAPQVVAQGSTLTIGGKPVFTAPERQDTDLIREYNVAKKEGFRGSLFDYKRQIALAGRPVTTTPPAPTVTEIQDPTNPSQMIKIDVRQYRGGGVGSPGVIGTSGKTAPVAAAEQKRTEGAQQAQDILDTLRTAYDELDRMRAVPSEQRNLLSNAISYVAGTGLGQTAGRVAGTKEQTQRDVISSARNQMLNAIKNATGMSAQQLNSNVEFRSWLEALTDPTRSIEANRAILDNMEKFIASGGKYSAKGGGQAAPAAASAGGATGGNLSPAEQAELDQLRARFGKK